MTADKQTHVLTCPGCRKQIKINQRLFNRLFKCPNCGAPNRYKSDAPTPPESAPNPAAPKAKRKRNLIIGVLCASGVVAALLTWLLVINGRRGTNPTPQLQAPQLTGMPASQPIAIPVKDFQPPHEVFGSTLSEIAQLDSKCRARGSLTHMQRLLLASEAAQEIRALQNKLTEAAKAYEGVFNLSLSVDEVYASGVVLGTLPDSPVSIEDASSWGLSAAWYSPPEVFLLVNDPSLDVAAIKKGQELSVRVQLVGYKLPTPTPREFIKLANGLQLGENELDELISDLVSWYLSEVPLTMWGVVQPQGTAPVELQKAIHEIGVRATSQAASG